MTGAHDELRASSALDRAAAAYVFGVMPGDESEATEGEIREMAERVLHASGLPAEIERLRTALREITTAGWDGDWAAERAREALAD